MRTLRVKEIYDKKGQVLFSVVTNAYALELLNVTNYWMERTALRTKKSFFCHFYLYYNIKSGLVIYPNEKVRLALRQGTFHDLLEEEVWGD